MLATLLVTELLLNDKWLSGSAVYDTDESVDPEGSRLVQSTFLVAVPSVAIDGHLIIFKPG